MRRPAFLAIVPAVLLALAGCSFGGNGLPFTPGSGTDGYEIHVQLADVNNLVRNAEVKVNDVTVGSVTGIRVDGWHADLTVRLLPDVRLADDTEARVGQKSLLGAQYLELSSPTASATPVAARTRLQPGAVIPLERTGAYPETEDLLVSLSMLLNGGGLSQIRTITGELNDALDGRAGDVRALLERLSSVTAKLEAQRTDITTLLTRLDTLSTTMAAQGTTVRRALPTLAPAMEVLSQQRPTLEAALKAVSELNTVLTPVLAKDQATLVAEVARLRPVLAGIAAADGDIAQAVDILPTITTPIRTANKGYRGDYANLIPKFDISTAAIRQGFFTQGTTTPAPTTSQLLAPTTRTATAASTSGGGR